MERYDNKKSHDHGMKGNFISNNDIRGMSQVVVTVIQEPVLQSSIIRTE